MAGAPDYSGWGAKQGSKVRTWKNRYFVLRGRELTYYSGAKSDASGAGVGEKGRLRVLNVAYSPDRKNGLLIYGEGKQLKMTTASAQESRVLFKRIKEAVGEQAKSFKERQQTRSRVSKEGWLLVEETQLRTWTRRYVVLRSNTVTVYTHQGAGEVQTQVVTKVQEDSSSPLSLRLSGSGGVIHVAAETREEIEDWDRAFATEIGRPVALGQVTQVQVQNGSKEEAEPGRKNSTAVCEGWLEKLGQNSKTWKKRYVSLANGMLEYRKGPMEQLSAELFVTDVGYSSEYSDALEIEFGSDKSQNDSDVICVRAESTRDLDKWMHALCDVVGKPRLEPPALSSGPSPPSSGGSADDRLSKPQLPPFPRNALLSQGSDNSVTTSSNANTQPSTPANADRSSGQQSGTLAANQRIKRGWLFKQGYQTKSWTLRYFILDGNALLLHEHINSSSRTLGAVASVTRSQEPAGSLCIRFEDESTLMVYGETKADTEAWFAALCKASWSSAENPEKRVLVSNQDDEHFQEDNGFRGWLLKKGQNFKTWKRRYFVLERSRLAYSVNAGGEALGSGLVFEVEVGDLRPFCLNIRFQNGRLLHVVAPTQEAFGKWLDVLRQASNLAESFMLQSQGNAVFDEEFDNDAVDDNANEPEVEFTEEDIAEYEKTIRASEGASLWIAAMEDKPEYDALSSSSSEHADDEAEDTESVPPEAIPRASDASSSADESQGCVGWLKKEGGNIKSWKRRYFTLYGTKLSYYKSEKGSLLRSVIVADITAHPSISLGLSVSTVGGRKLIIQAASQVEYDKWLLAIRGAVAGEVDKKSAVTETPSMNKIVDIGPVAEDGKCSIYSGWLEKEGQRFKTWKRRYFTLKSSALIYYSEIGGVARGHGMVRGAHLDETKPLTIVIGFKSGKTMRVTAASEVEKNSWLQVLSRGQSSSSRTTAVSDMSDDIVDSEGENDDGNAQLVKRLDSNDYFPNDTITNDTLMRLREEEGKDTFVHSGLTNNGAEYSFKGELKFDEEDEEKEDMGLSTTGADYYRQLLEEDERVQAQRKSEHLGKGEPPIAGCAPCCVVM